MNFSAYIGHATIYLVECLLVVGLQLRLQLGLGYFGVRCSVWVVSGYAYVFLLFSVVIVALPSHTHIHTYTAGWWSGPSCPAARHTAPRTPFPTTFAWLDPDASTATLIFGVSVVAHHVTLHPSVGACWSRSRSGSNISQSCPRVDFPRPAQLTK